MTKQLFFIIVVCLLLPEEVHVSRIYYHDLTLKDMVTSANAIYVVIPSDPFMKVEEIDIRNPVQRIMPGSKKKYPAYQQSYYCIEIVETLIGHEQKGAVQILDADNESRFDLHKRYYQEGLSKSPVYERYTDGLTDMARQANMIVFLSQPADGKMQLVCKHAFESINKKEDVINFIKDKNY
jgi:hypothetical protein